MPRIRNLSKPVEAAIISLASALVHVWLVVASQSFSEARPFGDLSLYNYWAFQVNQGGPVYGLQTDWVYPALAFLPVWLPSQFAALDYEAAWLVMIFLLNSSLALTLRFRKTNQSGSAFASWLFLASLLALGPIAISRIDSVSAVMAGFGIIAIASGRISIASLAFTIGGWIKIWPIALFIAMITTLKNKSRAFLVATICSATILLVGISTGTASALSFLSSQQERGLQIESVLATAWMWLAKFGQATIYFDEKILTNQVTGPMVLELASISNWIMFCFLLVTVLLALRAIRSGRNQIEVFVWASVSGVASLIALNKVGSPQFMIWLVIPVLAAVIFGIPNIRPLLIQLFAVLILTQLVYPIMYLQLLGLEELPLVMLTIRNLLVISILVHSNLRLASKQSFK